MFLNTVLYRCHGCRGCDSKLGYGARSRLCPLLRPPFCEPSDINRKSPAKRFERSVVTKLAGTVEREGEGYIQGGGHAELIMRFKKYSGRKRL